MLNNLLREKSKEDLISIIRDYESRTCGECKYGFTDKFNTIECSNRDSCCYGEIHNIDWHCADFGRIGQ